MTNKQTFFSGVNFTTLGETIEAAVEEEQKLTSCSYAHPTYDVHHSGGHPERSLLTQTPPG